MMRWARTSRIFAFVCDVSVTIPACEPVSEMTSCPRSLIAIAHSAQEMRSPVESEHVHLARMRRGRDLGGHRDQLVGRLAARREDGDDAVAGWRLATIRRAARLRRSASATDVPPNFITMISMSALRIRGEGRQAVEAAPGPSRSWRRRWPGRCWRWCRGPSKHRRSAGRVAVRGATAVHAGESLIDALAPLLAATRARRSGRTGAERGRRPGAGPAVRDRDRRDERYAGDDGPPARPTTGAASYWAGRTSPRRRSWPA